MVNTTKIDCFIVVGEKSIFSSIFYSGILINSLQFPSPLNFLFSKKEFLTFFSYTNISVGVVILLRDTGFKKKATWHEFYSILYALSVGVRLIRHTVHSVVEGRWIL